VSLFVAELGDGSLMESLWGEGVYLEVYVEMKAWFVFIFFSIVEKFWSARRGEYPSFGSEV
jgi:hypothetical protein